MWLNSFNISKKKEYLIKKKLKFLNIISSLGERKKD